MTVILTPEQEQFVAEQLKSGHYQSAGEIVARSLAMLQAQEEFIRVNVEELKEKIGVGLRQIRAGDVIEGRTVIRNAREKLIRRKNSGK